MGTYTKDTPKVDNSTDTSLLGREVLGQVQYLLPADCFLTKMIETIQVDGKTGSVKKSGGVIESKASNQSRVECFTKDPKSPTQTAGSALVSDDLTLANAATQIVEKMVFMNTANNTVGMVEAISGTTVTFGSIGSTAFSVADTNVLMYMGTMYEYGSSNPKYVMNTDDNHWNIMGIFRHPLEMTNSARDSVQNAGGNIFDRYSKDELVESVRNVERNFIFGVRPSSGNVTAMSVLGVSIPSARGLYDMAQATYGFSGTMTLAKIRKNLPLAAHRAMSIHEKYIWAMSKQAYAEIIELVNGTTAVIQHDDKEMYDSWGFKVDSLVTSGFKVGLLVHDAFCHGANTTKGLIFNPATIMYRYKNGSPPMGKGGKALGGNNRNWNIVRHIESNSTDTRKDDIINESCLLSKKGGYDIMTTTAMHS